MERRIKKIEKLPPDWLEIKIGEFLNWIIKTPRSRQERENKMIMLVFITIWNIIGAILAYSIFGR